MVNHRCALLAALVGCWSLSCQCAGARDHFLTIGGGYSPTGNQVSLEKNALFFQRLLLERHPEGVQHDILFSDGDSPGRDVQYYNSKYEIPRANLLFAQINHEENSLGFQYRSHQVSGIRGGSSRENLERWFQEVGYKLPAGDRLIIYMTGHGGHSNDPQNTHFYCWNSQQVSVRDLVAWLDKVPQQVSVVMVMVQCYSGGFANVIFQQGQSAKGLSSANRCGFFATVHDRPAAGCTPDIYEEDYHEYSSPFWAAIHGRTQAGRTVAPPDYDGNGEVSFAEAHAYSLLASNTIDISVKTSDALLRAYSKTQLASAPDLMSPEAPYSALLPLASPVERALLEGLSEQLGLKDSNRAKGARELATNIERERGELQRSIGREQGKCNQARGAIRAAVQAAWPEFNNRWDPQACSLLRDRPNDLVSTVESHASYSEFKRLHDEIDSLETRRLDLERKWCKCQRLLRVLENVVLAANLPALAGPDVLARYEQLLAAEAGTLDHAAAPPATAAK